MLAHLHKAKVLLGSATPSIESYVRAATGKYREVVLAERYGGAQLPDIVISDTIRAAKRGERKSHFNKILLDKIEERLQRGEQVLLFQNRRGVSPFISCGDCGWTARCPHCNVSLTIHGGGKLVCHYCGFAIPQPHRCPACKTAELQPMGFGTEKIEQEIAALFPEARVARLDRDTLTSESACNRIVEAFERGETDILVGTQIITKGFDFSRVTLVGVLNADNLLNAPDYRASERAFQTIMQFAGRGGRGEQRGEVVIQTAEPEHPILLQVARGDYESMAHEQSAERKTFFYPPYSRLVGITMRYRDAATLHRAAAELADGLRSRFSRRVLGPTIPPVDRVRGEHIVDIMLKIESGASFTRARGILRDVLKEVMQRREYRNIVTICNVDAS
jgi:primosomal protein N' (replication factor Y)